MLSSPSPSIHDLWFLPLGGCGEIGMNMNLYGHNGKWLMVDCGVAFSKSDGGKLSNDDKIYAADPSFIAQRRDKLAGLVITHAHEDHVGAVPYLWSELKCPIYTTPFTAEILKRKLTKSDITDDIPIHIVNSGDCIEIGGFSIEWVKLTHSIAEPHGLLIQTPAGKVFHTADWKLDPQPVLSPDYDEQRYKRMGSENITAMVCDSTNANIPGHSESEGALYPGLYAAVANAPGRVIVTCFGSNLARMQTLAKIGLETNRYVGLLGYSLNNMVSAAKNTGFWPDEFKLINPSHLGYLLEKEVLAIATGSQGEAHTALGKLANDCHPDVDLHPGDTVIFSSKTIPGNEANIDILIKKLKNKKVKVINTESSELPIHASGHPCQEELEKMYSWVKPRMAVPVHGEEKHMKANAKIANACGVPKQLVGKNGDLFCFSGEPRLLKGFANIGVIEVSSIVNSNEKQTV